LTKTLHCNSATLLFLYNLKVMQQR